MDQSQTCRVPAVRLGLLACLGSLLLTSVVVAGQPEFLGDAAPILQEYCLDCHGNDEAEAHVNLEQLTASPSYATRYRTWEKVAKALRESKMPPEDMPQPSEAERRDLVQGIHGQLDDFAQKHAGDPGRVVLRRLTSAEFDYTIQDLTGLDLDLEGILIGDAVGGEGFANVGDVQFVQDSTLERYLEAAHLVASHAVIGTDRLQFFGDPGKTGFELSAIHRIQEIYRRHGFRTAAGEGGEPFGQDLYPRAFYIAWRFQNRQALGIEDSTLAELAIEEGLDIRFAQHVWRVLDERSSSFPLSEITDAWQQLPIPATADRRQLSLVRQRCHEIAGLLRSWQSRLAQNAGDDEQAALLTAASIRLVPKYSFRASIAWAEGADTASVEFSVDAATRESIGDSLVIWRNPSLEFRRPNRRRSRPVPLVQLLSQESEQGRLFGAAGMVSRDSDFAIVGVDTVTFEFPIPLDAIAARLTVQAELAAENSGNCIVRCTVRDGSDLGDTAADRGGISAMLGVASGAAYESWKAEVLEFAGVFPEISHREPAPSDRDPIPAPFDNSYNNSERNNFHYAIKYHRDDDFLVNEILDDATRQKLDRAWHDLLSSFDYHDTYLQFIATKCGKDLQGQTMATVGPAWIAALPDACRGVAVALVNNFVDMHAAINAAEPRHLDDAMQFAQRAWRRPLTDLEQCRLQDFYAAMRESEQLSHVESMRALLTRILVAPAFLYRVETPRGQANVIKLDPLELASRLSYFLWSSPPDVELLRAAEQGELTHEEQLLRHARRMLRDPKARRFATEFFGQWFGFYRFHEYDGVDAERFPEFNEGLQAAMYEEAISFFAHVVREDRPVREILFADYGFLNQDLARHYGLPDKVAELTKQTSLVQGVDQFHRGGLLRLGAVHTVTSAPLRTSAVKRGDWILRRVLGTPVPPPPADAGSIPADDVLADGKTVRERLLAHRQNAACVNCHARMDPLGFALENFDPIGRWRVRYRDGQPIDASGTLEDGTQIDGLHGLESYLRDQQAGFYRTLCSKLLGYALGRSELLSDRLLLEQMVADLEEDGRLSQLVGRIVTSQQFNSLRGTTEHPQAMRGGELSKGNADEDD